MIEERQYFKFQRQEMLIVIPEHYSKVLEIGCGEGGFRKNLKDDVEYWGVEVDQTSAMTAQKSLHRVLIGHYDEQKDTLPKQYFDLVICNDVIEHMDDYLAFLEHIKTKMAPDASMVMSIPNVRYLQNLMELLLQKDWRYKDAGILDRTHLRFFTEKSIKRTLRENGWQVEKFQRINRYGSHRLGPKLLFSYLGQLIFGTDSAYMQFAINAKPQ